MRILLITRFFPPANSVASHRMYGFARFLPDFGVDVEVIAPRFEGESSYDLSAIRIHHPYKDDASVTAFMKKPNRVRDMLKYSGLRSYRHYALSRLYRTARPLLEQLDMRRFDAVLATYGPEDVLRLGRFVHRTYQLPLIIDYRDLWFDNLYMKWTPIDKLVISQLEKRILASASLVIAATKTVGQQIQERYAIPVHTIYNGFFARDRREAKEKSEFIHICYTGSLYGGLQPIHVIFPLLKKNPRLCLHLAVMDALDVEVLNDLIREYDLHSRVFIYENISNDQALDLQEKADILLYLNRMDGSARCVLAVKLYEYMTTSQFILGVGHPSDEAAELFESYNLGAYVTDVNELPEAIQRAENWHPSGRDVSFFDRRNQVKILAELIKDNFR